MPAETVFLLIHSRVDADLFAGRNDKIIGVFDSETEAQVSLDKHKDLMGFRQFPTNFIIHAVELDTLLANPIEIWE